MHGYDFNKVTNMCKCTEDQRSQHYKDKRKIQRLLVVSPFHKETTNLLCCHKMLAK